MKVLGLVYSALLTVGKKPTTWFIDGNNVLGAKGVTKDRDALADRLKPIESAESVVLVFDGRPGDQTTIEEQGIFKLVQLAEGISSDDYILEEIAAIVAASKTRRIELVTADRELRRLALGSRPGVKGVVNPSVFWKKYLPRMSGMKKRADVPEKSSD
jgi:hypothetical protein